ncbi:MAG TPA: hypothetical protein VG370_25390 [Chloroflexota bacterium]|nr:hypothetical protein [Chloroflexota bacterium]
MDRATAPASYDRVRAFLESGQANGRRVTAEWLAGRLGVPVLDCSGALDQLAADGLVRRQTRPDEPPWFAVVPPGACVGLRRVGLGLLVLLISVAVVATGAMLQHVFYFALGLGLGLMIAFAWLDWELRSRL